jgi:hypothetical protein
MSHEIDIDWSALDILGVPIDVHVSAIFCFSRVYRPGLEVIYPGVQRYNSVPHKLER